MNNSNNASRIHPITTKVASTANGESTIKNGRAGNSHLTNANKTENTTAMPNAALNISDCGYSTTSVAMPVIGQLKWIENAERASSRVVFAGKYKMCSPLVALRQPGVGSSDAWNSLPFLVVMVKVDDVTGAWGVGMPLLEIVRAKLIFFSHSRH